MAKGVYVGVNTTFNDKSLAEVPVGSLVKLAENGTLKSYRVLSKNYQNTGRVLLLRENPHTAMAWNTGGGSSYSGSTIDTWLTGAFFNTLSSKVQAQVSAITIPYTKSYGSPVSSISRKVFLLSATEVNFPSGGFNAEGTALSYFSSDSVRTAYNESGTVVGWWTRSPSMSDNGRVYYIRQVAPIGGKDADPSTSAGYYARPALTLPNTLKVLDTGEITGDVAKSGFTAEVARKVKKIYIGVDGVARDGKKGYIGVDGVARQFWQKGTPIGELPVGTTVKLNVNGTATNFLIVQQGLPSSVYDASCNGTWLLKKDLIEYMDFGTNNSYANSLIHSYMNGTFLKQLDVNIQSIIKQVKIPYVNSSGAVVSGSSGLSTKIFAISTGELGWTSAQNNASYGRYFPEDGAKLDYFIAGEGTEANSKRIAYYNGTASSWWTRSPSLNRTFAFSVQSNGNYSLGDPTGSHYIRPALILPSDTPVPDDMLIVL